MMLTIRNDFHKTEARVRTRATRMHAHNNQSDGYLLSDQQVRRIRKALCGRMGCT